MGFWGAVGLGIIGIVLHNSGKEARERAEEEERRKSTPCLFVDGISRDEFKVIAKQAGRSIKRLKNVTVKGPVVYGTVKSQSGLSEWDFSIDFNDYGHITGTYWISADNDDSSIPDHLAGNICNLMDSFRYSSRQALSDSYGNDDDYDDFDKGVRRQVASLKQKRRERIRKKVRLGFILTLVVAIACVGLYFYYKYQEAQKLIKVGFSGEEIIGLPFEEAVIKVKEFGFTNVYGYEVDDLKIEDANDEYVVTNIYIHGDDSFNANSEYPYDTGIKLVYHVVQDIPTSVSAKDAKKMVCDDLVNTLEKAGFVNIKTEADRDLITGWITKEGSVEEVTIDGDSEFSESSSYRPDVEVVITYHAFKEK